MKLVKLLIKELDAWPEHAEYAEQDGDREVRFGPGSTRSDFFAGELADETEGFSCQDGIPWAGRVTRADWEAERAKLKAPKANADGWIRHRGGKCPVEADQSVSVRHRDGQVYDFYRAANVIWRHIGSVNDVMAWKIFKPAEQQERADIVEQMQEQCASLVEQANSLKQDGPLEWRDRIRELDTQRAEVESIYQRQISEITQERESLVQKLAGEGLVLVEVVVQPVEDMSDWRKWLAGDLVEVLSPENSGLKAGATYPVKALEHHCYDGNCPALLQGGNTWLDIDNMRWHSRPAS